MFKNFVFHITSILEKETMLNKQKQIDEKTDNDNILNVTQNNTDNNNNNNNNDNYINPKKRNIRMVLTDTEQDFSKPLPKLITSPSLLLDLSTWPRLLSSTLLILRYLFPIQEEKKAL